MLLSIYIPTYNRAPILGRLLSILGMVLDSTAYLRENVEVIVSDNASTDDTGEVAECLFRDRFPGLRFTYHRNSGNIGALPNFIQAGDYCVGRFLWILGDDDIPLPHVFEDILRKLEGMDCPVLFLNTTGDEKFGAVGCSVMSKSAFFLSYPITSVAHISRLILERNHFVSWRMALEQRPGYYIWPLALPLANLPRETEIIIMSEPAVYATKDGGLEIWRHKTALARLAEFSDYCKLVAGNGEELSKLFRVNFPSGNFVAKKYLAASLLFPGEKAAFSNLASLLTEFGLEHHPLVLLGNFLRSSIGSVPRGLIRRALKVS